MDEVRKIRILKKPEERKSEILDIAEILFTSRGYNKTTINDILNEAKIAKGTFYYYFKSKEEVMDAVVMRYIDSGTEFIKEIAENSNLSAREKLFLIITKSNAEDQNKKEVMIEEFHKANNAEMHQKSLIMTITILTPIITKIIEQGIKEGVFKTDYPKEIVEIFLVSSQFLFDEGIFQWKEEDIIKKAKALEEVMERSLNTEKGIFSYISKRYREDINNKMKK